MKHAIVETTGPAGDSIGRGNSPSPVPGPGEVTIRMAWAPVNPADINLIEGTYGTQPELPFVPGMEGSGRVLACGAGVTAFEPGQPVIPLSGTGTWSEVVTRRQDEIMALPEAADLQQAAMLRVNPATAWHLLHTCGSLPAGAWILQNAASSALGHCVAGLARHLGLRCISLVRREESIASCLRGGADAAFLDAPESLPAIRAAMGSAPACLAINAVGGESASRLMDCLAPGGTLVTVGAMARQPLKVANRFLIFKGINLTGFWLTRWRRSVSSAEAEVLYKSLADLLARGIFFQPVVAAYPLESISEAVRHAEQSGRDGKVMLQL